MRQLLGAVVVKSGGVKAAREGGREEARPSAQRSVPFDSITPHRLISRDVIVRLGTGAPVSMYCGEPWWAGGAPLLLLLAGGPRSAAIPPAAKPH